MHTYSLVFNFRLPIHLKSLLPCKWVDLLPTFKTQQTNHSIYRNIIIYLNPSLAACILQDMRQIFPCKSETFLQYESYFQTSRTTSLTKHMGNVLVIPTAVNMWNICNVLKWDKTSTWGLNWLALHCTQCMCACGGPPTLTTFSLWQSHTQCRS